MGGCKKKGEKCASEQGIYWADQQNTRQNMHNLNGHETVLNATTAYILIVWNMLNRYAFLNYNSIIQLVETELNVVHEIIQQ